MEIINNPPLVERITDSLRDTGYELNTAIADIIDNSIAAEAKNIDVRIVIDFENNAFVSISDDGFGMSREELINAMRYGSSRRLNPSSLGKFGLGLKTASTAFCKKLTVVTRSKSKEINKAIWDLDYIAKTDNWSLQLDTPTQEELGLLNELTEGAGTVVIWEKIDRLFNASEKRKEKKKYFANALKRYHDSLSDHLSMVYQRFLDFDDERARNVNINLNGKRIKAWDPFFRKLTKMPVDEKIVPVEISEDKTSSFKISAYILPRKEEYDNDDDRNYAKISNELQGIYIYRENRLIHGPDWLTMYKQEPHFSLIRVELSFDYMLDDAFQVDLKKSRILLNGALYEWLRDKFLAAPRREAEMRYRKGSASTIKGTGALLHSTSNNTINQKVGDLKKANIQSINPDRGEVSITNNEGTSTTKIRIVVDDKLGPVHIETASTLDNGVLWEASLLNGRPSVTLNSGHPYYQKSYLPNKTNSIIIQALDYLLWALAQAELNNTSQTNQDAFEEFRIEVSRNLKKLVADLPEPTEMEIDQNV
jgi:hypothetical protein